MRGIREAAMSQEKEETTYYPKSSYSKPYTPYKPYKQDSLLYKDQYNPTKAEIARDEKEMGIGEYESMKREQITITFAISEEHLTDSMSRYYDDYDFEPVKAEAITMAYDKLIDLLGKEFESKYSVSFDADEGYGDVEVVVTLTKIK